MYARRKRRDGPPWPPFAEKFLCKGDELLERSTLREVNVNSGGIKDDA